MKNSSFSGNGLEADAAAEERREKRRSRGRTFGHSTDALIVPEDEESVHELFNEVPSSERRVEKPLLCTYGNGSIGHLHITRNYVCWNSVAGRKVVIHFSEIASVEKGTNLLNAIEVKTLTGKQAPRQCQSEPMHDWGPGITRCHSCGAQPCWNRGCKTCKIKLCKGCFDKHKSSTGEETAKHIFKTRDLDRIFTIVKNLWAAHLRIPKDKRPVRAPSAMSQSSLEIPPESGTQLIEEDLPNYQSSESEETLIDQISSSLCTPGKAVEASHFPTTSTRETTALLNGVSETVKAPIELIFKVLQSEAIQTLHVSRKDENIVIPPWESNEDKSIGIRSITYLTSTPLGKKLINESQRYWWTKSSLCLETSAQCPGVPCGSSFRTVIFYEFTTSEDVKEVQLRQWGQPYILSSLGLFSGRIKSAVAKACEENATGMIQTLEQMIRARSIAASPTDLSVDQNQGISSASPVTVASEDGDDNVKELIEMVIGYLRCVLLFTLTMSFLSSFSTSDSTAVRSLPFLSSTTDEVNRLVGHLPSNNNTTDVLFNALYHEVHRSQWTSMFVLSSGFLFALESLLTTLSNNGVVKDVIKSISSSISN